MVPYVPDNPQFNPKIPLLLTSVFITPGSGVRILSLSSYFLLALLIFHVFQNVVFSISTGNIIETKRRESSFTDTLQVKKAKVSGFLHTTVFCISPNKALWICHIRLSIISRHTSFLQPLNRYGPNLGVFSPDP